MLLPRAGQEAALPVSEWLSHNRSIFLQSVTAVPYSWERLFAGKNFPTLFGGILSIGSEETAPLLHGLPALP